MEKISFKDKVAVVTGAGGGLGRAYARDLASRGAAVVVNDLGGDVNGLGASRMAADAVVAEIRAAGGTAIANYDSVAISDGGNAIIQAALDAFGRIDALINNAGILRQGPFDRLTDDDVDALIDVHLKGAFNVTRPAFRSMKKQGYGRILMTSSSAGLFGGATQTAYGAVKAGIVGLMHSLALEGKPYNVICNALLPMAASRMGEKVDPEDVAAYMALFERFGNSTQPDFVAPMAAYLVSTECNTTHGIYSAVGGRFARVFVGCAHGWYGPRGQPSTAEAVRDHMAEIEDRSRYSTPLSVTEEFAELDAHFRMS